MGYAIPGNSKEEAGMNISTLENVDWADSDFLLTRKEAATILRVKPQTLAKWACLEKYELPVVKVGARVRYRLGDVRKYIRSQTRNSC